MCSETCGGTGKHGESGATYLVWDGKCLGMTMMGVFALYFVLFLFYFFSHEKLLN